MNKCLSFLLVYLLIAGCVVYDRNNPYDPANPRSHRDRCPVVLSFFGIEDSTDTLDPGMMAKCAYDSLISPTVCVSFSMPLSNGTSTASSVNLKNFLKNNFFPDTGYSGNTYYKLPRVYTGNIISPVIGIASSSSHIRILENEVSQILNEDAFWTIEAESHTLDTLVNVNVTVARLGERPALEFKVMAFISVRHTDSWSEAIWAFDPHVIKSLPAGETTEIDFSVKSSSLPIPLSRQSIAVCIVTRDGTIEQGALF